MHQTKQIFAWFPFLLVFLLAAPASSQFVVTDPGNLAQNIISGATAVKQLSSQALQIKNEIEQILLLKKNLEQLSAADLANLDQAFRRLNNLYNQAEQISLSWDTAAEEYDEVYSDYDPEKHSADDYKRKNAQWREQSKKSSRSAMKAHSVISDYDEREAKVARVDSASDGATGSLAAIQAGNKMASLLARQLMELNELIVADSRARLSYLNERAAKEEASKARGSDVILRSFGGNRPAANVPNKLPTMR